MRQVLVTGANGFVGTALCTALEQAGYNVVKGSRDFEGLDAVVHLAGEPIASSRWTEEKKERIRQSRIEGTSKLTQKLAELKHPPKVFICASAIGFYGNRGEEIVDENSPAGKGFLADVCVGWEKEARELEKRGVRTVQTRFGMVLGKGGALAKMILPYKLGLGGKIGAGQQWISWIDIQDLVRAILFTIEHNQIRGAVNVVAPGAVRQRSFAKTLGKVLNRPVLCWIPKLLVRLIFGQMGEEILLSSARVYPSVLLNAGFRFEHPDLAASMSAWTDSSGVPGLIP